MVFADRDEIETELVAEDAEGDDLGQARGYRPVGSVGRRRLDVGQRGQAELAARQAFLDTLTRIGTGPIAGTFDTRPAI